MCCCGFASMVTSMQKMTSKWLDAHKEPMANLFCFSQGIDMGNIAGDGDYKLVLADLGSGKSKMRMKVYKGVTMVEECALVELPVALMCFYMDKTEPRTPAVAVASGSNLYVYKNLKPYYKFALPGLDLHPTELDLWDQARTKRIDVAVLREMLEGLRNEGPELTGRSMQLISMRSAPLSQLEEFVEQFAGQPLKRNTVITCMAKMNKTIQEDDGINCILLGTECASIFIVDAEAFTVLERSTLPHVPVFMVTTGLYDVDFRIVCACRNGAIMSLRKGEQPKLIVSLSSQPVALTRQNKGIVVGCMDMTVACYSTKGKKMWQHVMPDRIICIEPLDHSTKGYSATLVALGNGEVRLLKEKFHVDTIQFNEPVSAMRFGRFGREDHCLVAVLASGALDVKILKRTATFEEKYAHAGPPASQFEKLNIPKKTKLFIDQTYRERQNAASIHRTFQSELLRLKLRAARNYLDMLDKSVSPISVDRTESMKLSAQVTGLGPTFKLTVNIQSTSADSCSAGLYVTFQYDQQVYSVRHRVVSIPLLVPRQVVGFSTFVDCLLSGEEAFSSGPIRVLVAKTGQNVPLVTALIEMPVCENLL